MKKTSSAAILAGIIAVSAATVPLAAAGKPQAAQPRREPDMCAVPPGAQPLLPATLHPGMGTTTNFPVTTTSEEARKFFLQGVSQIHSFWFQESERSCLQALALDPKMAMAHWCIAVSAGGDFRPAFQLMRDPSDGGRAAAAAPPRENAEAVVRTTNGAAVDASIRAREAIEKAMAMRDSVTPRERLYIEAQAARRAPGNREAADKAYIAGMRKLVAAYPDDLEAKSMLALGIDNGFHPVTREARPGTMEAIELMEEVVRKDDNHFGAHHYLIHAWEGSRTPEKAWRANERYPALVPNIPHALHMPGHIYAQSDRVDDAIEAFTVAAENELKWLEADSLYPNGHHGHNVHFLIHASNLGGRYQNSMKWVQHLFTFKETPREKAGNSQRVPWRQGYFGLIKTTVRFERWADILDGRTIPVYDKPEQQAWRLWAIGLAHSATGNQDRAKATLADLEKLLPTATASREPLAIAAMELDATITARSGDRAKAWELFRKAADREATQIYTEPPAYPRPVMEGWANTALALGEFAVAERAYRELLTLEPGSGRAYLGLAKALGSLGWTREANEARERGLKAWAKADRDLPQLQPAQPVTAQASRE
jgi:tetratricopeptide (TPR) repeat protein